MPAAEEATVTVTAAKS